MSHRTKSLVLAIALAALPLPAFADGPDARVARVSYAGGDTSYLRGDGDDWSELRVNTPLVSGDSIYAADGARAEVELGGGNVVRIDAATQLDLIADTTALAQLGLRSGAASLRVRSVSEDSGIEIDTPTGAATVLAPGVYRVEMTDDGARFSVVKGHLAVAMGGQQVDVDGGESLVLGGGDDPTYAFDRVAPATDFDRWAYDRDVRAERSASARYVHPDVVGYDDLDGAGSWRVTPAYGRVWTPYGVPAGWAPYQSGRWIWQDPYGWTWVSYEPWGWAPYHYGRWVYVGGAWGWVPPRPAGYGGPSFAVEIQPTYAPALVAFVGGKNWSVGISLGGGPAIGWVPLAPRERYYYPWQPAPRVTNNYTNITVINAVTVVNQTTFATGPVHPIHVPPREIAHAPRLGYTAAPVVPTHDSLCVSRPREPRSRFVPRRVDDRPFVVRATPPPRPVPFKEKVVEIERTSRPFAGHDRGERIAAVPASARDAHRDWRPRPGSEAKAPRPLDRDAARMPRETRGVEPSHGRPGSAGPAAPSWAERNPKTELPHGRGEPTPRDARLEERAAPQAGRPEAPRPSAPRWAERPAPAGETGASRTRPAEPATGRPAPPPANATEAPRVHGPGPGHEPHAPAPPARASQPVNPAPQAAPSGPRPEAAQKAEAANGAGGKDKEKEKGKDKHGREKESNGR